MSKNRNYELQYLKTINEILEGDVTGSKTLGDDAAIIESDSPQLIVCQDMLVEDVHFRTLWSSATHTAYKAVASNLSDMAAMNATPFYASISLAVPPEKDLWVDEFYREVKRLANQFEFKVIGGDLVINDKVIVDINMIGTSEHPISNCTARPGDWICVTGPIGTASLGFYLLENDLDNNIDATTAVDRFLRPPIRIGELQKLSRDYQITSCTDISDGLIDETRTLEKLTGFKYNVNYVPIESTMRELADKYQFDIDSHAENFGEDYELLFTISGAKPIDERFFVIGSVSE